MFHCSCSSVDELSQGQGNHLKQVSSGRGVVPQNAGQWDENPTISQHCREGNIDPSKALHLLDAPVPPAGIQPALGISHSEHLGTGDE